MTFKELEPIEQAFRSVAPYILDNAGHEALKLKTDGTPVTEIDIETERRIKAALKGFYAGVEILGEETGYDPNNLPNACWLIDPIDGTKSYIENFPSFTTMGLYVKDNEAVACVVYNPTTDEMFTAVKGQGAYLNGDKLDLTMTKLPKNAVVKARFVKSITDLRPPVKVEAPPSGAGYPFIQIAKGALAARFNFNAHGHIHDYATGILLVQEAGGVVIPINDEEVTLYSKSFVACHPLLSEFIHDNKAALATIEKDLS